ncbi:MAG: hypothetical protein ISS87_00680 [Candidatus Pacebacteria bacterium]|nr:hypothetical protein [Candidatus Paceibacterota bacterium]
MKLTRPKINAAKAYEPLTLLPPILLAVSLVMINIAWAERIKPLTNQLNLSLKLGFVFIVALIGEWLSKITEIPGVLLPRIRNR